MSNFNEHEVCENIYRMIDYNIPYAMWCLQYVYFNPHLKTMNIKYRIPRESGASIASDVRKLFLEKLGLEKQRSKIHVGYMNEFSTTQIEELVYKNVTAEEMYVLLQMKGLM